MDDKTYKFLRDLLDLVKILGTAILAIYFGLEALKLGYDTTVLIGVFSILGGSGIGYVVGKRKKKGEA